VVVVPTIRSKITRKVRIIGTFDRAAVDQIVRSLNIPHSASDPAPQGKPSSEDDAKS
jgi:hypothetical protein